jgi:hypothetical protein
MCWIIFKDKVTKINVANFQNYLFGQILVTNQKGAKLKLSYPD